MLAYLSSRLVTVASTTSPRNTVIERLNCCSNLRVLSAAERNKRATIVSAHSKRVSSKPKQKKKQKPKGGRKMASPASGLTVAFEGCCHGELDTIYATLQLLEARENKKIDLLVCCGDFQAVRNLDDMDCMAVPQKYKRMMTFYKYYKGEEVAPYPTLFIGGNHEAINHLRELFYGGWVAPNMYFLGYSGVVNFGGLRIGGLSGIYNQRHYNLGHFERLPYNDSSKRSAYHVREQDVFKLKQIKKHIDVFLSHDWPIDITDWGNRDSLIGKKPFFKKEIHEGSLGSPAASELMHTLEPSYWFSAHLHVKFPAVFQSESGKKTKFLALDKCLPKRDFLQVVHFPKAKGPKSFYYDEEWLGILRATHNLMDMGRGFVRCPQNFPGVSEDDKNFVKETLRRHGKKIPRNFEMTVTPFSPSSTRRNRGQMPRADARNPQTEVFLEMLGLPYNLHFGQGRAPPSSRVREEEEIAIPGVSDWANEDDVEDEDDADNDESGFEPQRATAPNPEEIALDDDDDDDEEAEEKANSDEEKDVVDVADETIDIDSDDDDDDDDDAEYRVENVQSNPTENT